MSPLQQLAHWPARAARPVQGPQLRYQAYLRLAPRSMLARQLGRLARVAGLALLVLRPPAVAARLVRPAGCLAPSPPDCRRPWPR